MSKVKISTFGETLRNLREENKMPLRKLAALLDIDQSTLSKIERDERKANLDLISKLSLVFNLNKKTLQIDLISDRLAYELLEEENPGHILKVTEKKLQYLKTRKHG